MLLLLVDVVFNLVNQVVVVLQILHVLEILEVLEIPLVVDVDVGVIVVDDNDPATHCLVLLPLLHRLLIIVDSHDILLKIDKVFKLAIALL